MCKKYLIKSIRIIAKAMNMSCLCVLLAASITALTPNHAIASLVDMGATTLDTATGLEWLDLTATRGQSYDSVAAGFGGFTTTQGFQFATVSQVMTLFGNAGFSEIDGVRRVIDGPPATLLIELLGCTSNCSNVNGDGASAEGLANSDIFSDTSARSLFYFRRDILGEISGAAGLEGASVFKNHPIAAKGSFLLKPVPVPAALPLYVSAIAAMGLLSKRRKLKQS